jgi:hypothetical protein
MGAETARLLEAFEALPPGEKQFFTQELLRRALPLDSGPLEDDEIAGAADGLFSFLSEEENAAGTG